VDYCKNTHTQQFKDEMLPQSEVYTVTACMIWKTVSI